MSSRQLRKLQQQRELEQAKLQAQAEDEEESEEEPVAPVKAKPSLFANLAGLEDPREDEEVSEEDVEPPELNDKPAPPSASKKSKKKKKKAKKAKERAVDLPDAKKDDDEIEKALRELALEKPKDNSAAWTKITFDPEYERVCSLLGAHTQHLKVANEMRNLFGKAAVEVREDPGGAAGRGGRRRQRAQPQQVDLETALKRHPQQKGIPQITLRRNALIEGKEDWPGGTAGGLTMEVVDDKAEDGTVEFRFVHNQGYQDVQRSFHGLVEMGDPQNLIGLLTRYPYHISLLIQVSKIAKDQSDHSLSADLLERALFTFGRASLSLFNNKLSQGKARLDFSRPENRELWLAGYQYMKNLVMKGTYRTALEWAKLLLSLDPEDDPYCMRLVIHELAVRAHEFQWLLDFSSSKMMEIGIMPGAAAASHTSPSVAYAAMQLRDGKQSRKLLTASMQRLPWLFTHLFKEINLDAPPSIWGITPRTDAETLFTELYTRQTKELWDTPETTSLLMEVAHTIPKVSIDSIPLTPNSDMSLDVVRFVYLDSTPAIMSLVPSNLLHRSNNSDADPLPPFHNTYSYENPYDSQHRLIEGRDDGGHGRGDDDFFDPIAALARLIPGLRAGPRDEDDDGVDVGSNHADEREAMAQELQAALDNGEGPVPPGLVQRLLGMFWRTGIAAEDEGEESNTDTGDGMPELVEERNTDSDNEVP